MMQVWHYWMVTHWTVVPEHHSLEIRPLAAIFTLLLQKKKSQKKKRKEKRKLWKKLNPNSLRTGSQKHSSSASLVFTESITSRLRDGVPTRDPWTGFPKDVAWWRVWSSQHHPAFARQPVRKNKGVRERKTGIKKKTKTQSLWWVTVFS